MTIKRSVALAALVAVALSSTTGFAAKKSNPEDSVTITDSQILSGTVWTAAKIVVLQQYLTKVAPKIESRLNAVDSSNGTATNHVMNAIVTGLFLNSMKDYFSDLRTWSWDSFGAPVARHLPEPMRSIICD